MKVNQAEHQRGGLSRFWYETTEWNAIICSVSFFLIFTAFGTVQNFATSTHGDSGAISLTILYAVLTVSNIIVPLLLNHVSPKWAMFLGSSTYAIYVGANIHEINVILYIAAALEGFGAAVLWVGQGSFITKCAYEYADKYSLDRKSQLGYYNGLFWAWMVGNQFVGNLLAALLFAFGTSDTVVYVVLTTVNVMGVLLFLLIRPFDSETSDDGNIHSIQNKRSESDEIHEGLMQHQNYVGDDMTADSKMINANNDKQKKSTLSDIQTVPFIEDNNTAKNPEKDKADIMSAIRLMSDYRLHLLIFFTLFSGMSQTFEYGSFPSLIDSKSKKFFAMSIFGVFDAAFSLWFGKLSDKIGRLPVLFVAFICQGSVFVFFLCYHVPQDEYYYFFILAALLGIGDAGFNTQLYSLYASLLGEKPATFANLKFWQSVAMTWGFLWQSDWVSISWDDQLIANLTLMIVAAIPLFFSKTVRDAAKPKSKSLSFS